MFDYRNRLTITMADKNHYALLSFLKKHGGSKRDIPRFVEEAVVLHIIDREMAFHHAGKEDSVEIFSYPAAEARAESWPV